MFNENDVKLAKQVESLFKKGRKLPIIPASAILAIGLLLLPPGTLSNAAKALSNVKSSEPANREIEVSPQSANISITNSNVGNISIRQSRSK